MPAVDPSRSGPNDLSDKKSLSPLRALDPCKAWRITRAPGPLAATVHELNAFVACSEQSCDVPICRSTELMRILQVGAQPGLLQLVPEQPARRAIGLAESSQISQVKFDSRRFHNRLSSCGSLFANSLQTQ